MKTRIIRIYEYENVLKSRLKEDFEWLEAELHAFVKLSVSSVCTPVPVH